MILKIVVLNGLLIILPMSSAFFRCREEIQIIATFCRALSGRGALGAGDGSSFNTLCGAQNVDIFEKFGNFYIKAMLNFFK